MAREFLGRGMAFPIRPAIQGGVVMAAEEAKVRQSIWLILATAPGERIMLPSFGCGVHDLVFEPNTPSIRGLIRIKVRDALEKWEPRIDVQDVVVETSEEHRNHLLIDITYRVRSNNAIQNMVYPFFLHEQNA